MSSSSFRILSALLLESLLALLLESLPALLFESLLALLLVHVVAHWRWLAGFFKNGKGERHGK